MKNKEATFRRFFSESPAFPLRKISISEGKKDTALIVPEINAGNRNAAFGNGAAHAHTRKRFDNVEMHGNGETEWK